MKRERPGSIKDKRSRDPGVPQFNYPVNDSTLDSNQKFKSKLKTQTEKWSIEGLPTCISTSDVSSDWVAGIFSFMKSQMLIPGIQREGVSLDELLNRENKIIELIEKGKL